MRPEDTHSVIAYSRRLHGAKTKEKRKIFRWHFYMLCFESLDRAVEELGQPKLQGNL